MKSNKRIGIIVLAFTIPFIFESLLLVAEHYNILGDYIMLYLALINTISVSIGSVLVSYLSQTLRFKVYLLSAYLVLINYLLFQYIFLFVGVMFGDWL